MVDKHVRIIVDSKDAGRKVGEFDSRMRRAGQSVDGTTFALNKMARAIGLVIAGGQLISFISDSISVTKEFEKTVSELGSITGATGEDLKFLSDTAREFGATTTLSATQAATAIKLIASAKPDLLESGEALKAVTREAIALAEAAGIDLPTAANALGGALNQFNAGTEEAGKFINILAEGARLGASEINDTAGALKAAGVAAAAAKVSFAETNAAIQVIAKTTKKGSDAGTELRNILLILDTNIDKNLNPSVVGLSAALQNASAKFNDTASFTKLFGRENVNTARFLADNVDLLDELSGKLSGPLTTAYDQAANNTNNLAGDTARLNSAYQELQLTIGTKMTASVRGFTQELTSAADFATKNIDSIITGVQLLTTVIGARLAVAVAASSVEFVRSIKAEVVAINQANAAAVTASTSVNRYTGAIVSSTVATRNATVAQHAFARAATAARGGLALLGGPLGVLAIAASALAFFAGNAKTATEEVENLRIGTEELSIAQAKYANLTVSKAIEEQKEKLEELTKAEALYLEQFNKFGAGSNANKRGQQRAVDNLIEVRAQVEKTEEKIKSLTDQAQVLNDVLAGKSITDDPYNLGGADPFASSSDAPQASVAAVQAVDPVTDRAEQIQARVDAEALGLRQETAAIERELAFRIEQYSNYGRIIADAKTSDKDFALATLNEQLAAATFAEQENYLRRREMLQAERDYILESDEVNELQKAELRVAYNEQEEALKRLHQETLTAIDKEGADARLELLEAEGKARLASFGQLGNALMSLGQNQSKGIFKIGQKLALAQAAVALPSSVLQSFQNGGGYPWGLAPAGAMLATGLKNIQQIKNAGSGLGGGGGGSIPSVSLPSGSTGGAPVPTTAGDTAAQAQTQNRSVEVRIQPGLYSDTQVRELMEAMAGDDTSLEILATAQSDAQRRSGS